jgi:hypothetical protein
MTDQAEVKALLEIVFEWNPAVAGQLRQAIERAENSHYYAKRDLRSEIQKLERQRELAEAVVKAARGYLAVDSLVRSLDSETMDWVGKDATRDVDEARAALADALSRLDRFDG